MSGRRAALGFIFVTALLNMLSFGIVIPVLPRLVAQLAGGDVARAAHYLGLFGTAWALMQFCCAPLLGLLSDRYGRRPVILLSNLGLGVDYVVMALAPSIAWLFFGRVVSGITSASMPAASAYISDVTAPAERARAYGLFGAAFGIGFIVGPALGGWLGASDPRLPFWAAAALSLGSALYGLLVLPESLAPEHRRRRLDWREANPVGALRLLRSHRELFALAAVSFLSFVAHEVYVTVFVLYANLRYGWDDRMVGAALALVGVTSMIVSALLVGPTVRWLGERRTLQAGLAFGVLGFVLLGVAATGAMMMVAIAVDALAGLANGPSLSLMTQRIAAEEQGALQGALAAVRGIAMLIGPGLFAATFATFLGAPWNLPAAPWYLAALLLLLALLLALGVRGRVRG
ncbi:MAG: TCR/Tet family MFS transporter [Steroidobacteraceae bacterium]